MLSKGTMQEVLFAQRLADNEKKVRDKALKKLKVFISLKTSYGSGLSEEEALKIWKGLFYCMYMADKPLVQEEVAEEIGYLLHDVRNPKDRYTFISAAFRTFAREWNGIDTFRMDKFMMFMRRVLRQVFVHLKLHKWSLKEIVRCMNILDVNIVRAEDHINATPLGIKLHLCSIIMEELAKIAGEDASSKVILAVLKPFLKVLAISKLDVYRNAVAEEIIRHLMRQTEIGQEGEEAIQDTIHGRWPQTDKTAVGNEDIMDDDLAEEDDDDIEMEERTLEEAILDPRAGSVSVFVPQLKPDFNLLANALQDVGALKNVSKTNRNLLYTLVKECKDMAGNSYPLAISEDEEEDEEGEEEEEGKAVERLQEFYSKLKDGSSADASKIEDLKADPLKNLSIEKSQYEKKSRKKKMKLKRLKKKLSLAKKKALAKQQAAAEVNRLKAVEAKLGQINEDVGVPNLTNMPLKRKNDDITEDKLLKKKIKSSKPSKMSKRKSEDFEVSNITPDNVETKTKVPSNSGFEVTPIKDNKGSEPDNEVGKVQDNSQLNTKSECLVDDIPEKVKGKKKKNKKKGNANYEQEGTTDDLAKEVKDVPEKVKGKKKKKDNVINEQEGTTGDLSKEVKETVTVESDSGLDLEKAGSDEVSRKQAKLEKKKDSVKTDVKKPSETNNVKEDSEQKNGVDVPLKASKKKKSNKKSTVNEGDKGVSASTEVFQMEDFDTSVDSKHPLLTSAPGTPVLAKSAKKTPTKAKGLTMNFSKENGTAWSNPLEQDIEIFLKNRRNMKLERRKSGASINSPKGTPKTPKTSKTREKTIKINLKENQEHDFKDYVHSVRNSPQIPYSADKLPKAPVLKPSLSPILVGKPALKILKNVMRKSPSAKSASPLSRKSPKPKKMNRNKAADFF